MTDDILLLTDREKVRQRPGMYIGDNDKLGLQTMVREIIDNAIDEYQNYPDPSKPIDVILHSDNSVTVRDYGRGISPYKSTDPKAHGEIQERLAYTRIGAGGKFDQNRKQNGNEFSGGLNGTGSSATNFMSEFFDVTIWRDGYQFHDRFENGGEPVEKLDRSGNLPKVKLKRPETGTQIHFRADSSVMTATKVDNKALETYFQQSVYLNQGLTIRYKNERDGDEDYTAYYSENGLLDYIQNLNDEDSIDWLIEPYIIHGQATTEVLGSEKRMIANIALGLSNDGTSATEAFTNGVYNELGGTHVIGAQNGLLKLAKHYYKEFQSELDKELSTDVNLIKKTYDISDISSLFKSRHITNRLYMIMDFKHNAPILQPQTKDKLASKEATAVVEDIVFNQSLLVLDKNINGVLTLIKYIIKNLSEKAKEKQDDVKLDEATAQLLVSTKLAAVRKTDPTKNEIILVEGDSAAGTIKANRDSNYQAILPLRGKVLNVQKATPRKTLDNLELSTIIATLGCGFGENFDITKLKYHKIIIGTDQDVDGLHIRCLLITFFMKYMPGLITNGHIYFLDTPLFVNELKAKNAKDVYAYSDAEQAEILKKYKGKISETQRNKGLGELSEEQTIETILNPETRKLNRITVENVEEAEALIAILMGDNNPTRQHILAS